MSRACSPKVKLHHLHFQLLFLCCLSCLLCVLKQEFALIVIIVADSTQSKTAHAAVDVRLTELLSSTTEHQFKLVCGFIISHAIELG